MARKKKTISEPPLRQVPLRFSDGPNAQAVLNAFRRRAASVGWPEERIRLVTDDAASGDYGHLFRVLARHCENGGF